MMYRVLMFLFGKRFIRDLARMVAEEVIRAYELGQKSKETHWYAGVDFDDVGVGGTDA